MTLIGKPLSETIKSSLRINDNTGVDATVERVTDGAGANTAIKISKDNLHVVPGAGNDTDTFLVSNLGGDELLKVDSTNTAVKAIDNYVNTQVKNFCITAINAMPSSANTWTALSSIGSARFIGVLELGTGSTPDTSLTISTDAHNVVQAMWYVPFNITIDSCLVWFGADAATGDAVKFSVMQYAVDSANGATSGDLSSGSELCNQPIPFNGQGYEQAYYTALTVASANVDAGKVIVACVHQDGTNADLTVNMQLVYHLR